MNFYVEFPFCVLIKNAKKIMALLRRLRIFYMCTVIFCRVIGIGKLQLQTYSLIFFQTECYLYKRI